MITTRKIRLANILLAMTVASATTACSDMGSDADIEVMQQQEQLRSDVQRLESNTARSSLRDALEDPRLHPYALARSIYDQSGLQMLTILTQFAVTLSATNAAPVLLDEEIDQLLAVFRETNPSDGFYSHSPGLFYFLMLRLSQQTPSQDRTEWLRKQTENQLNRIDGDPILVDLREQLFNYYIEIGEPERAHELYAQLQDDLLQTKWALPLAKAYAQCDRLQSAIALIDGSDIRWHWLVYFIEEWVELLLLVDRQDQAIDFLMQLRSSYLNSTTLKSHSLFLSNSQNFILIVRLLGELELHVEAREALRLGYKYVLENHPSDDFLIRGVLPYLKGFKLQNDVILLEEAKRAIFARLYDLIHTSDDVERHIFEFVDVIQELELDTLGLEFVNSVAQIQDSKQAHDSALITFALSQAYVTFGDKESGDRYLQTLLRDFSQLEALMEASSLTSRLVITHLLELGYFDEAKRLMGSAPNYEDVQLLLEHLLLHERFVDALTYTAEQDAAPAPTILMLLRIARIYLQHGKLPNAEVREAMARHWSRYMSLAKESSV